MLREILSIVYWEKHEILIFLILFDTPFTPRTPNLSFRTLGLPVRGAHSSSEAKLVVTLELVVFVQEEEALARVGDRQGGELEAALPVWPPGAGIHAVWARVLLASQHFWPSSQAGQGRWGRNTTNFSFLPGKVKVKEIFVWLWTTCHKLSLSCVRHARNILKVRCQILPSSYLPAHFAVKVLLHFDNCKNEWWSDRNTKRAALPPLAQNEDRTQSGRSC